MFREECVDEGDGVSALGGCCCGRAVIGIGSVLQSVNVKVGTQGA